MPTIVMHSAVSGGFSTVYGAFEKALFGASIVSATSTKITLSLGTSNVIFTGTGFNTSGGNPFLTGAIEGFSTETSNPLISPITMFTFTDFNLSAASLLAAVTAENAGTDTLAVENIFF